VRVALKKLKNLREVGYDVKKYWADEAAALEEIKRLRQRHLIRSIAAINRGPEYYIIFEWANGGSLREFWDLKPSPADLNADRVIFFLREFVGLAQALSALHRTNTKTKTGNLDRAANLQVTGGPARRPPRRRVAEAPSPLNAQNLAVPEIQISGEISDEGSYTSVSDVDRSYRSEDDAADDDEEHWRHGDLKPDNILLFTDADAENPASGRHRWMGTLKIADLGLAKQHFFATVRRDSQTGQKYTTSHYEAPEAIADLHLPRSRRYDIWSMACVIFEFVIILLYGKKGLDRFYDEKDHIDSTTETIYFSADRKNNTAEVSSIFSHWANQILDDPECKRPEGSAIADIVRLVRDRLLVVDVPRDHMTYDQIQSCRANAGELHTQLENIWSQAKDDEQNGGDYLVSKTINRKIIPVPRPSGGKVSKTKTTSRFLGENLQPISRNLV